jgi:hypothetical protein
MLPAFQSIAMHFVILNSVASRAARRWGAYLGRRCAARGCMRLCSCSWLTTFKKGAVAGDKIYSAAPAITYGHLLLPANTHASCYVTLSTHTSVLPPSHWNMRDALVSTLYPAALCRRGLARALSSTTEANLGLDSNLAKRRGRTPCASTPPAMPLDE